LNRNAATGGLDETVAKDTSAGVADAGSIVGLNSEGKIDQTMMPAGIGIDTKSIVAGEALAAGDLVYVYDDAGTPKIRKANAAAAGQPAVGYVKAAVASSAAGTVFFGGENTYASGLTTGSRVYLSDSVAGKVTSVPVAGAGKLHQYVGRALSPTEFRFEPDDAILLAA
jgi:hypothetical protein